MRVTVDQLLKLGCLSQAKVLAGSRGLSNAVSSVGALLHVELEGGLRAFVVPVIVSHSRLGYVCAFSEGDELGELERVALENAATVAAVEMARDQARFETEVRLKGDFVDDLIGGRFSSADSLMRRASFLGCDLSKGATVLVADFDEFERGIAERGMEEEEIQRLKNRFFNKCTRLVAGAEPSSLVSLKSDHVICLLSGPLGVTGRVWIGSPNRYRAWDRRWLAFLCLWGSVAMWKRWKPCARPLMRP